MKANSNKLHWVSALWSKYRWLVSENTDCIWSDKSDVKREMHMHGQIYHLCLKNPNNPPTPKQQQNQLLCHYLKAWNINAHSCQCVTCGGNNLADSVHTSITDFTVVR